MLGLGVLPIDLHSSFLRISSIIITYTFQLEYYHWSIVEENEGESGRDTRQTDDGGLPIIQKKKGIVSKRREVINTISSPPEEDMFICMLILNST